jgi:hypothetical protein
MAGRIIVHDVTIGDCVWPFHGGTRPGYIPAVDGTRAAGSTVDLDPFPAYPHDRDILDDAVAHVLAKVGDLRWDVHLYNADREETSRSNGHSQMIAGYADDGQWRQLGGMIFLSGKRIPPHPAMTRYLVAHELGHNIEWMLQAALGHQSYSDDLISEYADLRRLPASSLHHGEGGTWHDSATEIFGCDFRVVVCDVETEYWPHPGVPTPTHPSVAQALRKWWARAIDTLGDDPVDVAA